MHHPTARIVHTMAIVTPVVEHWLERTIAQWVHHEGWIRWPIAPWANALTMELQLAPYNTAFNLVVIAGKNAFLRMCYAYLKLLFYLMLCFTVVVVFSCFFLIYFTHILHCFTFYYDLFHTYFTLFHALLWFSSFFFLFLFHVSIYFMLQCFKIKNI